MTDREKFPLRPAPLSVSVKSTSLNHIGWRLEEVKTFSEKFQWLPSTFNVKLDGSVSIESYINNLHPVQHASMYSVLEEIFSAFIPLFNNVLTDLSKPRVNRIHNFSAHDWYVLYLTHILTYSIFPHFTFLRIYLYSYYIRKV